MAGEAQVGLRVYLIDEFSAGLTQLSDLLANIAGTAQAFGDAFASAMETASNAANQATDTEENLAEANDAVGASFTDAGAAAAESAGPIEDAGSAASSTAVVLANLNSELMNLESTFAQVAGSGMDLTTTFDEIGGGFGNLGTVVTEVSGELPLLGQSMALVVSEGNSLVSVTNALIGPFEELNTVVDGWVVSITEVADEEPAAASGMQGMASSAQNLSSALNSLNGSFYEDAGVLTTLQEQYAATEEAATGVANAMAQMAAVGASSNATLYTTGTAMSGVGAAGSAAADGGMSQFNNQMGAMYAMMAGGAITMSFSSLASSTVGLQMTLTQVGIASGATGKLLNQLQQSVISVADASKFGSDEVGAAFALIMERGYSATDTINHLGQAAVNLAEATGSQLSPAAVLLSSTMQTFGASANQAEQYASALTFAFYHGIPSVDDLQTAMAQVGGTASALGIPIEQVAGTLDYLVRSGLSAQQAGTSLRYMLSALADPTSKAADELATLGIYSINASGGLDELIARTDAAAKAAKNTPAVFDGTVSSLNAIYTQGKKLGTIQTDQTFYQWALAAGYMSNTLYNAKGQFVGIPGMIQQIGSAIQGLPTDQKLAALQNLFNVRGGQGAMHLLNDLKTAYPQLTGLINQMQQAESGQGLAQADANKVMADAGNQFKALQTTVGSALQQAFLPTVSAIGNLASHLNTMIGPLTSAKGPAHDFMSVFLPIMAAGGFGLLAVGLIAFMAPVLPAIGALVLLAGGIAAAVHGAQEGNPYLVAMGIAIGVIGAIILTAWVGPMLAGAAANLAFMVPLLPVIIIIMALTAVVVGIIAIIMHWGQIVGWLGNVWQNDFVKPFQQGVKDVEQFWNTYFVIPFQFAVSVIGGIFSKIGTAIHQNMAAIGVILTQISSPINLVVSLFTWLYDVLLGHSIIPDIVKGIFSWFNNLKTQGVQLIQGFLQGMYDLFVLLPAKVAGYIGSMISSLIGKITTANSMMGKAVTDNIITPITNTVNGLVKDAESWGENLLKMLGQGIANGISGLMNQVTGVANKIKGALGFHSPTKEGPLSDSDEYMPNMMKMYASGILSNTHLVTGAVSTVATGIKAGLTGAISTPSVAAAHTANAQAAGNGQMQTINLNIDGKTVGTAVLNNLTGQMQLNGLNRAWR